MHSSAWQWPPIANVSIAAIQSFSTPAAVHVVGHAVGRRDAAHELVHVAEVADQEPQEGDLAEIEMGEIDAGAENAPAAIFLVVHRVAAHDRDLGRSVEGATSTAISVWARVVSSSALRKRGLIMSRWTALPRRVRRAAPRSSAPRAANSATKRGAFRPRQQHGVTEMPADARARKHMGEEHALVDLDAVLVALAMSGFGADLVAGRHQSRNKRRPPHRRDRRGGGSVEPRSVRRS